MRNVIDVMRVVQPAFLASSVDEQRAGWDQFGAAAPLPPGVVVQGVDAGGVAAEWVRAPRARPGRVVEYLHGGGYVIGSPSSHRHLAARLSAAAEASVLLVDYRRAPEHPYPAALDDATAAWRWLVSQEPGPSSACMAGDSAGAGLALSTAMVLRDAGERVPVAVVCFSPWVDLSGSGESVVTRAEDDVVISAEWGKAMADHYLAGIDPRTPLASPLFGELAGLPPMLILVGTAEILYDDATRLAQRAAAAGVEVSLEPFEGAIHEWMMLAPGSPEAEVALSSAGDFLGGRA